MATLIAHWDFDGPTDKSGNGHTLVHGSGGVSFERPLALYGASPHYLEAPTLLALPNSFSLAIDLILHSRADNQALLALNLGSYENAMVIGIYSGALDRRIRTTTAQNYSVSNLPLGTRFQLVLTFQALTSTTAQKLYVNGVEIPSAAYTHSELLNTDATAKAFSIGQEWDSAARTDFFNATLYEVKVYNGVLTALEAAEFSAGKEDVTVFLQPVTTIPANEEPRSQFEPQDVEWRGSPGAVYAGPMPAAAVTTDPLCQGQDLAWVRDGIQNVLQGYIESTVTIDGEGVRRRVLCLDQAGNLIGETYSRASDGKYRFDLLWLNRRYMLVAQDDPAFGPADYNAVAADYQLPTPYAPGEGVGLSGG